MTCVLEPDDGGQPHPLIPAHRGQWLSLLTATPGGRPPLVAARRPREWGRSSLPQESCNRSPESRILFVHPYGTDNRTDVYAHADATLRARPPFARATPLAVGTNVTVIGSGSGIPFKIDSGGAVRDARSGTLDDFVATTDTFGGNSGSGVYENSGYTVAGILVRGETDYKASGSCNVVRAPGAPRTTGRRTQGAGGVGLLKVWRQAPGAGVRERCRRGASDSGAPGPAHGRCKAGPGARVPPSRRVLKLKPQGPRQPGTCRAPHGRAHRLRSWARGYASVIALDGRAQQRDPDHG
ncbi:hypothetical protein ASNO1_29560 [Corallococcus caeni]|uniref:Serine protease n=1 Tax=Corallococcus caeni TaxID=3082388 RepID=A0ABQ6QTT3_9BACT|nr:hypothetical protein ASNO1_29560 [Corallococcus sp. NO1]